MRDTRARQAGGLANSMLTEIKRKPLLANAEAHPTLAQVCLDTRENRKCFSKTDRHKFSSSSLRGHGDCEGIWHNCSGVVWIRHAHVPGLRAKGGVHCRVDGDHNRCGINHLCWCRDLWCGTLSTLEADDRAVDKVCTSDGYIHARVRWRSIRRDTLNSWLRGGCDRGGGRRR